MRQPTALPQILPAELDQQAGGAFSHLLRNGLAAHGLFFVLAIGYLFALAVSLAVFPPASENTVLEVLAGVFVSAVPIALLAILVRELFVMVRTERPASPSRRLMQRMKGVLTDAQRMASGLPMFLAFMLFMFCFTAFKGQITAMVPFSWDQWLDNLDRGLHGGYRPWELLRPILGSPLAVFLLNLNYNGWFMVMNLILVHFAFYVPSGEVRTRFFLTFMGLWLVGGTVLATSFSSAGPCYFGRLGLGEEAYGPLMARLTMINQSWPIWAVGTQDMLWAFKQQGSALGGVSAMPSMHNATALLFVLALWNQARWVRSFVIVHAALIFLGSVLLGWHYAVDAYAAFGLAAVLWLCAKPISVWWHARPHVAAFDRMIILEKVS